MKRICATAAYRLILLTTLAGLTKTAMAGVSTLPFNYPNRSSLIAGGWSFDATTASGQVRNTESTQGPAISYDQVLHPGEIRIPAGAGDFWGNLNDTRDTLFRPLPLNWMSVTVRLNFAPDENYQQAGIALYENDDRYVQVLRTYEHGQHISFIRETGGLGSTIRSVSETATTGIRLRLDRPAPGAPLEAYYSLNGVDWIFLGTTDVRIHNPRLAIVAAGSLGSAAPAAFRDVTIVSDDVPWPEDEPTPLLSLRPGNLVFNATEGIPCPTVQTVIALPSEGQSASWTASPGAPWLTVNATSGTTPSEVSVGVDVTGLQAGVYETTLTWTASGSPAIQEVGATLIVNPAVPVGLSTWKDGRRGAFSASTDDSQPSGFNELLNNGLAGTFVMNGTSVPPYYPAMHAAGMELGAHTVSHFCHEVSEATLRAELEENIAGLGETVPDPFTNVISLVWPCGFNTLAGQAIAAEYFLSARGYNINELEDATPSNFMNLKSFNSHEHVPFPPADLKDIVDAAESERKWANLVLHDFTNDDGAIAYSATRDVWVAPIGTVIKYILQRDRTILSGYQDAGDSIRFDFRRLSIAPSVRREFENAIQPSDTVTFRTDVSGRPFVTGVTAGGAAVPWSVRQEGAATVLYFSSAVTTGLQSAEIAFSDEPVPALTIAPSGLTFTTASGSSPAPGTLTVANTGSGVLSWSAAVNGPAAQWLTVSPASGTGDAELTATVNSNALAAGTYQGEITISAPGAFGSPGVVGVTLVVTAEGVAQHEFTYPNRAALLADGWDFLARTAAGAIRDTEQTSGAVVTYNASGGLTIPADTGDLWEGFNNTRNSLFRDLPAAWTSVTARIDFAPSQNTQQAGIVIYQDDNNYVQITRIFGGGQRIVAATETNGTASLFGSIDVLQTAGIHLRLERQGAPNEIAASWSPDGIQWTSLGSVNRTFTQPRAGVIVCASPDGYPNAQIHWVRVEAGDTPPPAAFAVSETSLQFTAVENDGQTPAGRTVQISGLGDGGLSWTASPAGGTPWLNASPASGSGNGSFTVTVNPAGLAQGSYNGSVEVSAPGSANGAISIPVSLTVLPGGAELNLLQYADRAALLAAGWDFLARTSSGGTRDTEQTSGAVVTYNPAGGLSIPADTGDLWESINSTRNSLFRDLPAAWTSVSVRLRFAPTTNYQQAGLVVYQDDDNYFQITRVFNGSQRIVSVSEQNGVGTLTGNVQAAGITDVQFSLRREPASGTLSAWYSVDGVQWNPLGEITRNLTSPRIGLIVGASPGGFPVAEYEWVRVESVAAPVIALSEPALEFVFVQNGPVPPAWPVVVANSAGGGLSWTATANGSPWLSVSPASGSAGEAVSVSVLPGGLSAGEYQQNVTITAPGAANSPATLPVKLVVVPAGTTRYYTVYPDRTALLQDGWDFLARTATGSTRDTEYTAGATLIYDPNGTLRIPADAGDLWEGINNTRNTLFRNLPPDWTAIEAKLSFAPQTYTQQAGIAVYENDDSYVQVTRVFAGSQQVVSVNEQNGTASLFGASPTNATSGFRLRLTRNPSTNAISAASSPDGTAWTDLGSVTRTFGSPRLAFIVCASPWGYPEAALEWIEVTTAP